MLTRVARDLSVALIAEGVESAEDLDVCFSERVFAAQGYFLARPEEAPGQASPEFSAWLATHRSASEARVTPEAGTRRAVSPVTDVPETVTPAGDTEAL
jgi:predicted signal transduction protein with EAL and GGDEF domain